MRVTLDIELVIANSSYGNYWIASTDSVESSEEDIGGIIVSRKTPQEAVNDLLSTDIVKRYLEKMQQQRDKKQKPLGFPRGFLQQRRLRK